MPVREHIRIEPQPVIPEDGWDIHEKDATGQWFRPRGDYDSIYPFMPPPHPGLTHGYCEEHNQLEWVPIKEGALSE